MGAMTQRLKIFMKKILYVLLCTTLLMSCVTTKQVMIPKERIKKEVCEVEANIKYNDIFLACHEFILDEFASYNGVLKYHDKETGVLLLNWKTKCGQRNLSWASYGTVWIDCSTKIQIVDNIVSFEHRITNITMNVYDQWKGRSAGVVDSNELTEEEIMAFKKIAKRVCNDFISFLNRY